MMRTLSNCAAGAVRTLALGQALAVMLLCAGCGETQIEAGEVMEGSVLNGRPTTLREGGEPVTGTVVRKNAEGRIIESIDYRDGFPNGWKRVWYDNGQLRSELEVAFRDYGGSTGLVTIGTSRSWCENGTLSQENVYDDQGRPTGQHRTWTCRGELLTVTSYPSGEYRLASEYQDGGIWLIEEGVRDAESRWEGAHTRYHQNGNRALVDHWKNGLLDGPYQEWDEAGSLVATGSYAAGQRIGTWRTVRSGFETIQDYDSANFVDPNYTGPFMQAAGIRPSTSGWVARLPLQDYAVDADKLRYYVTEGLVNPKLKLHNGPLPQPFVSSSWTYPYVQASRAALDLLVELGADPKAVDSDRRSRLHHCMFSLADGGVCSPAEVGRLIGLGLPVDEPDIGDYTPLLDLVMTSWYFRWAPSPAVQLEVAELLLDAGADPDRQGGRDTLAPQREGLSPLMAAANAKRFELARLLLERSSNPAATHKLGYNLVHLVFLNQNLQQFNLRLDDQAKAFIELAVHKGVDPAAPLGEMGTLKDIAERAGAIDLARFLAGLKS